MRDQQLTDIQFSSPTELKENRKPKQKSAGQFPVRQHFLDLREGFQVCTDKWKERI